MYRARGPSSSPDSPLFHLSSLTSYTPTPPLALRQFVGCAVYDLDLDLDLDSLGRWDGVGWRTVCVLEGTVSVRWCIMVRYDMI